MSVSRTWVGLPTNARDLVTAYFVNFFTMSEPAVIIYLSQSVIYKIVKE